MAHYAWMLEKNKQTNKPHNKNPNKTSILNPQVSVHEFPLPRVPCNVE